MNQLHTVIAIAILLLAASAHAQECSGGKDGGMDATGNECNKPAPVVAPAQTPAKSVAARETTGASRSVAPSMRMPNRSDRLARVTTPQGR